MRRTTERSAAIFALVVGLMVTLSAPAAAATTTKDNGSPSGVYQERGAEIFVGSLDGGPAGTFATTYMFNLKWDPDVSSGSEVHGRCQHPIVAGSGTGGFVAVTGRVDFKLDVDTGECLYRGHLVFR